MPNKRHRTAVAITGIVAAGSVLVTATPATADHGRMHDGYARLHAAQGFPHARGPVAYHSDYDSHHSGMDEEFHVVVRGIKELAGKRVRVYVHGDFLGRAWVNPLGRARLHRHYGIGTIHEGWGIRIRTGAGKLVAYSNFDRHM